MAWRATRSHAAAPAWTTATAVTRLPATRFAGTGLARVDPPWRPPASPAPAMRRLTFAFGARGSGRADRGGRQTGSVSSSTSRSRFAPNESDSCGGTWRKRRDRYFPGGGAHQLLRVLRGQPVQEELVQLELGRGELVHVRHLDVPWGRGGGGGEGKISSGRAPQRSKRGAMRPGRRDRAGRGDARRTRCFHQRHPLLTAHVHFESRHRAGDRGDSQCARASPRRGQVRGR